MAELAQLAQISITDERLSQPNRLCRSFTGTGTGTAGVVDNDKEVCIAPAQYFRKAEFATLALTTKDMIHLLTRHPLSVACDSDVESTALPEICQRVPTRDRRNAIRLAWQDPLRTPTGKHETIELSLFGAVVDAKLGIRLNAKTLAILTDGAGRMSALIDEVKENNGGGAKKLLWQLNIDLSGDLTRPAKTFLSHNRDGKRASRGTTSSVEAALLGMLEDDGVVPTSFIDKLARTYVVRRLYRDFDIAQSLTELFPWGYEGKTAGNDKFVGTGRASNVVTAIGSIGQLLDQVGITPKELPEILDFSFRRWYAECPTAVHDSRMDAFERKYRSLYHFSTTLALKVIMLVSTRAYLMAGVDKKAFTTTCEAIIQKYFSHHRNDFSNSKAKKMTLDKFWQESVYFAQGNRFNSGAVNTINLLKQINTAADEVCGQIEAKSR